MVNLVLINVTNILIVMFLFSSQIDFVHCGPKLLPYLLNNAVKMNYYTTPFNGLFSRIIWLSRYQKDRIKTELVVSKF